VTLPHTGTGWYTRIRNGNNSNLTVLRLCRSRRRPRCISVVPPTHKPLLLCIFSWPFCRAYYSPPGLADSVLLGEDPAITHQNSSSEHPISLPCQTRTDLWTDPSGTATHPKLNTHFLFITGLLGRGTMKVQGAKPLLTTRRPLNQ
jgi:hypothetical protein